MGFATVSQIRAVVFTSTLSDSDISELINAVSDNVLKAAGTTDTGNDNIILAGVNAIYAAVIRKAIETTEFANSVKRGNIQQQQDLTTLISFYTGEYTKYLARYLNSSDAYSMGPFIYGRVGYNTVNNKL